MYTIEDFKNGKCAVINDGTVKELNKILALVKWPFYASGSDKYYWKNSNGGPECNTIEPPIPTQSVKDFIKQLDEKENKSSEIKEKEFTFSEDDIPSDFPYHPYVLDQGIQERCRQRSVSPKEAFDYCTQSNIGTWFAWNNTTQEHAYWSYIDRNPNFIPANYTPKHFSCKHSKLPLCGVIDSEYQSSNLTKEKKDFMIPASYTEVELTIKKPICKF